MTTARADEQEQARIQGGLALVALDRVLFPRQGTHTADELVAQTGADLEIATRLWRAMGFTAVPDDAPIFVDDDLDALRSAMKALSDGVPLDEIIYQTRVISAAMARAAEVTSDNFVARVEELHHLGLSEDEIVKAIGDAEQQDIDHLIGYFYRRQLREAIWRKMAQPEHQADRTVMTGAFIDLVYVTAITEIVGAIKTVAEIVSDIASASAEQANGIEQVDKALAQMDEATQQNSALVEENAATAKTLEQQAKAMDERVSFFRLSGGARTATADHTDKPNAKAPTPPKRPAAAPAGKKPIVQMRTTSAASLKEDAEF